jgi:PAS domain S-box-containing protein
LHSGAADIERKSTNIILEYVRCFCRNSPENRLFSKSRFSGEFGQKFWHLRYRVGMARGGAVDEEDKTKDEHTGQPEDVCGIRYEPQGLTALQNGAEDQWNEGQGTEPATGDEEALRADFPDGTQILDLSGLFSKHVSASGSFHAKGIGGTLLEKVLEALPIPVFLIDHSTHITFANQACRRIHEDYQGTLGKPFDSLFPDQAAAGKAESILESVFSTRKLGYHIGWLQINDGRMWGRVTLRSVRIGRDRFLLALVEDLTAEKWHSLLQQKSNEQLRQEIERRQHAEQAQRQSEQRFELAIKGADLSWWDWTLPTGSLYCDRSFAEMLGYSGDEIAPHKSSWEQLVHPDDVPRFSAALKAHLDNVTPHLEIEHRVRSKPGAWKWVLTRGRVVKRCESGLPVRASGTNLDITEVKEARERIDALTHAMIQAQEWERSRISLDLHDQVAQDLSALRLSLQEVCDEVRSVKPELSDRVAGISEQVRDIVQSVRGISYELVPPGLEDLGLASTVQQYCGDFSKKHRLAVDFVSEGFEELQLDFDTEINVFRVVQEALNNVAKHAHAAKVVVRLRGSQSGILLSIRDDGTGFDVTRQSAAAIADKRMGLWCMEQRIGLLGGRIDVTSTPASGTEIVAEVPLGGGKHGWKERGPDSR